MQAVNIPRIDRSPFAPLMRRVGTARPAHIAYYGAPVWALLLTAVVVSGLLLLVDVSLNQAYTAIFQGALGNTYSIGLSLTLAIPLILTGMAVALAYQCGLFNIGAEGQLQVAGLGTTLVAVETGNLILAVIAGIAAGAVWGGVPGYLRARLGVNEIISTLMLNFIAITGVLIVVEGPFSDPNVSHSTSPTVPDSTTLPVIVGGTPLHAGLFVALAVLAGSMYVLFRTPLGLKMRAVGHNDRAASHGGINVRQVITAAMVLSGAVAGLAGTVQVLGVEHNVASGWSSGWGYTGIAVAFLARSNPVGILPVALLYGALDAGAENMQLVTGVPGALLLVIQALPVLFLVALISRGRPAPRSRPRPAAESASVQSEPERVYSDGSSR